ncbi:MAG TPA: DNA methyltransferase [Anaerolineae bacterium]|nr:DNA methyltransferase [Anaerolineae bacterium]
MVELTWDGKYDANGKKVAPLRLKLPFQTVETVNESAQERQMALDMFTTGGPTEWRNRLIWGDKKYVLPALLDEFGGEVNLIYIDPPFNVGADFSFTTSIPESPDDEDTPARSFVKEPSILEQKAYRDTWGRGLDSYLQWFYETVTLLRELLHETGSLYVHLDYHVGHYSKAILDEVFGIENMRNEVIWQRTNAHASLDRFGPIHDTIYYYAKSGKPKYNDIRTEYREDYLKTFVDREDSAGRRFMRVPLTAKGTRNGETGQPFRGIDITAKGLHWKYKVSTLEDLDKQGRIYWPEKEGGMPRLVVYEEDLPGMPLQDIWVDIRAIHNMSQERLGYDTQKPEALLERVIRASSNEGDLVLDCFCGSGTTAAVAEKLGRRWITCDLGRFAIHTTRKRLLAIPNVKPFVVQNLGKYERQAWQKAEFANSELRIANSEAESSVIRNSQFTIHQAYIHFILSLYHARPLTGYVWLHGVRNGRMVHVGAVDAPISPGDVTQIALEFRKAVGSGQDAPTVNAVDILGWDFAFELNEVAKQQATLANLNVRFVRIPREVLEKKAVEQGDIKFFELAALAVDVAQRRPRGVTLRLTDFVIPPDDVPADVQAAITHWSQWIDYWAVDWDNHDDTFHNMWQTYRTRKDKTLSLEAAHTYDAPGEYRVMVKVIDILGNDTTKTIKIVV